MATASKIVWQPQAGSQALFLACPIYEVLYEGTRGPGKTDALLMDFAQHTGQGFGAAWRGVLFRRTFPELSDIIAKSKRWFRQIFSGVQYNSGSHTWIWPTGEELMLRHFKDPDDYFSFHGFELPFIAWEELTNWPNLDGYETMKSCSRSSWPGMPRKIRATANPYGRGHNAVKSYFIDMGPPGSITTNDQGLQRTYIHGVYSENKALLAADPQYPAKLAADGNEQRRKAWLYGSWDVVSGGMFDDVWSRTTHFIKPFTIPRSWHLDRSFDWGSTKPFSVGWWAESDGNPAPMPDGTYRVYPKGTVFRIAEWYGCEKNKDGTSKPNVGLKLSARDIARGILEREKRMGLLGRVHPGPADPAIFTEQDKHSIAKSFAEATFDEFDGYSVTWTHGPKQTRSRKQGWELVREMLQAAQPMVMEAPGLFIFDTCTQFARTVPTLPRDEDDPDDVDTEAEDHAGDETRYRCTDIRHTMNEVEILGA